MIIIGRSKILGYTVGTFDLLHTGHIKFLEACRTRCDGLIVAVNTDDLVVGGGKPKPIISQDDRVVMLNALRVVKSAFLEPDIDKMEAFLRHRFDVFFVGDDWRSTNHWLAIEAQFRDLGVSIIYLPYTVGVSSTSIRDELVRRGNAAG